MEGTAPLVAAKLGVPAVSHGFGFGDEASMTEAIFKKMVEERERHGVQGFPEVRESIDVAPPSMVDRPGRGWPTGALPDNRGGRPPGRWAAGRCGTCRTTEAACCPSGCSNGPRARASR